MATQSQNRVLNVLLELADEDGRIRVTDTELAFRTGFGRRSVQYAIRHWKDAEVIPSELNGDSGTKQTLVLSPTAR